MDYAVSRRNMIDGQILPNEVTDPAVIDAMASLPREAFVPKASRGIAYVDEALPLGGGRYLMEPMVLARLLQAADIKPDEVVLDIGCATGYDAAVLGRMASAVVALECDDDLVAKAENILAEQGSDSVVVVKGPLEQGVADQAPFDVIVFSGAVAQVPQAILDQVGEGGRLVAVVLDKQGIGRATLMERDAGVISERRLFDAGSPVLPGLTRQAPRFVF